MERSKAGDYLYRSLLDENDSSVRELVGYLRSSQMGELGQLFRTAEAMFRYLRSEVVDYLATKKKASPDIVAAAMKLMTRHDPASPSHELMSDLALSSLGTYIRAKREFSVHCAHEFFLASADRESPRARPSSVDMSQYGIGHLPSASVTGIKTKRQAALKLSWHISKNLGNRVIVLSGYNTRQLELLHLMKFKAIPRFLSDNCVVVPFETWESNRKKLDKYLEALPREVKLDPELIVMSLPDGPDSAEMETRDKMAVEAIAHLKSVCCDRKIPGLVMVSTPMIKHQQRMPPVSWYSLLVDQETNSARMIGADKVVTSLDFWRQA